MKWNMKKTKIILIGFIQIFFLFFGYAQKPIDFRINELYLNNIDNLADEYGRHVPWVEIFNTSYNTVELAECYLTNDTTGLAAGNTSKWYRIPKGDEKTLIPRRGFVIFYLDNTPTYGVFHTNFDPTDTLSSNYIALIASNGKTIIHLFEFPEYLKTSSHSYGYKNDYGEEMVELDGKLVKNLGDLKYFTPGSQNNPEPMETKAEKVAHSDKYGIGITLISMTVVFFSLFLIFIVMKTFTRLLQKKSSHSKVHGILSKSKKKKETPVEKVVEDEKILDNGEEIAAISMALHLFYNDAHDYESEIITIETPNSQYSPWSQKNLTMKKPTRKS